MKGWSEVRAIDANVILRYVLGDQAELSPKAREIMHAVEDGRLGVYCDPVTLAEAVQVLVRFYQLERSAVCDALQPILMMDGFLMPKKSRYVTALKLFAGDLRHFGDACACATALEECEGRLLSFDRELSNVSGIARFEEPA